MAETVAELMRRANSLFVDEYYARALELYDKALELDPSNGDAYLKRSHANFKLGNWEATIADVDRGHQNVCTNPWALLRKGQAAFHLDRYDVAKEAFEEGAEINGSKEFDEWIEKCHAEIKHLEEAKHATPLPPPAPAKIRHEWYQTESHVIITILLKNQKPENIETRFTDTAIWFGAKLPSGDKYELSLQLAHPVVGGQTTYKCYSTKVEIKAKKKEGIKWNSLEYDESALGTPAPVMFSVPEATVIEKVPSVFKTKNWDSIIKETENEKEEGDAALNALFQKIYAEGSDDVRRAMNKSFLESGGTVLSTNWDEISSKTTPIKPPDGMEYRKWQQ